MPTGKRHGPTAAGRPPCEPSFVTESPVAGSPRAQVRRSVYQRVLGEKFAELDPRLQTYFGPIPAGHVGRGTGVYRIAGSRLRVLRPVLWLMARRNVLFPEFGREVPFSVVNVPGPDGTLSATRTFRFPRGIRIMEDTMAVVDGHLVDRLGKRRGFEVVIELAVVSGGLRMTSTRLAVRFCGIRLPLPPVATMTLDERTDPVDTARQRVDVRITAPVLREIFRYSGEFTYVVAPAGAD